MKKASLKINGIEYKIKFGFGANRIMAKQWNLKTLGEVGNYLSKTFQFKKNAEPTIEQLTQLGDFVLAGILNVDPTAQVDSDDIINTIMSDVDIIANVIALYTDSMPKLPPSKNVKRGQKK